MLQRVCSAVEHSWRQSVVRTKKWRSELWGLNATISASCDCSVAIFTTSLESQESYLTLRDLTIQINRDISASILISVAYTSWSSQKSSCRGCSPRDRSSPRLSVAAISVVNDPSVYSICYELLVLSVYRNIPIRLYLCCLLLLLLLVLLLLYSTTGLKGAPSLVNYFPWERLTASS